MQFEFGWGSIATNTTAPSNGVAVTRGALVFALHPEETTNVTQTFPQDLPARPHARDLQIGTTDVWNYAIDTNTPPVFVAKASKGWSTTMPFDTDNFPFAVQVKAKQFKSWGYWEGSMITADIPPSPVDCAGMYNGGPLCGDEVTLNLVPYGGTNIRCVTWGRPPHPPPFPPAPLSPPPSLPPPLSFLPSFFSLPLPTHRLRFPWVAGSD